MIDKKLPVAIAVPEKLIPDAELIQEGIIKYFFPGIDPEEYTQSPPLDIFWIKESGYFPGITNQIVTKLKESKVVAVIFYNPEGLQEVSHIASKFAKENRSVKVFYCSSHELEELKRYDNVVTVTDSINLGLVAELSVELTNLEVDRVMDSFESRLGTPPD